MDFPYCLLLLLSISVFLLFRFSVFYTFLVVGSVRYIKLTYVGFRARVKIASRIVSHHVVSWISLCVELWDPFDAGLTFFDSFRQSLKTHLFGDRSASWVVTLLNV